MSTQPPPQQHSSTKDPKANSINQTQYYSNLSQFCISIGHILHSVSSSSFSSSSNCDPFETYSTHCSYGDALRTFSHPLHESHIPFSVYKQSQSFSELIQSPSQQFLSKLLNVSELSGDKSILCIPNLSFMAPKAMIPVPYHPISPDFIGFVKHSTGIRISIVQMNNTNLPKSCSFYYAAISAYMLTFFISQCNQTGDILQESHFVSSPYFRLYDPILGTSECHSLSDWWYVVHSSFFSSKSHFYLFSPRQNLRLIEAYSIQYISENCAIRELIKPKKRFKSKNTPTNHVLSTKGSEQVLPPVSSSSSPAPEPGQAVSAVSADSPPTNIHPFLKKSLFAYQQIQHVIQSNSTVLSIKHHPNENIYYPLNLSFFHQNDFFCFCLFSFSKNQKEIDKFYSLFSVLSESYAPQPSQLELSFLVQLELQKALAPDKSIEILLESMFSSNLGEKLKQNEKYSSIATDSASDQLYAVEQIQRKVSMYISQTSTNPTVQTVKKDGKIYIFGLSQIDLIHSFVRISTSLSDLKATPGFFVWSPSDASYLYYLLRKYHSIASNKGKNLLVNIFPMFGSKSSWDQVAIHPDIDKYSCVVLQQRLSNIFYFSNPSFVSCCYSLSNASIRNPKFIFPHPPLETLSLFNRNLEPSQLLLCFSDETHPSTQLVSAFFEWIKSLTLRYYYSSSVAFEKPQYPKSPSQIQTSIYRSPKLTIQVIMNQIFNQYALGLHLTLSNSFLPLTRNGSNQLLLPPKPLERIGNIPLNLDFTNSDIPLNAGAGFLLGTCFQDRVLIFAYYSQSQSVPKDFFTFDVSFSDSNDTKGKFHAVQLQQPESSCISSENMIAQFETKFFSYRPIAFLSKIDQLKLFESKENPSEKNSDTISSLQIPNPFAQELFSTGIKILSKKYNCPPGKVDLLFVPDHIIKVSSPFHTVLPPSATCFLPHCSYPLKSDYLAHHYVNRKRIKKFSINTLKVLYGNKLDQTNVLSKASSVFLFQKIPTPFCATILTSEQKIHLNLIFSQQFHAISGPGQSGKSFLLAACALEFLFRSQQPDIPKSYCPKCILTCPNNEWMVKRLLTNFLTCLGKFVQQSLTDSHPNTSTTHEILPPNSNIICCGPILRSMVFQMRQNVSQDPMNSPFTHLINLIKIPQDYLSNNSSSSSKGSYPSANFFNLESSLYIGTVSDIDALFHNPRFFRFSPPVSWLLIDDAHHLSIDNSLDSISKCRVATSHVVFSGTKSSSLVLSQSSRFFGFSNNSFDQLLKMLHIKNAHIVHNHRLKQNSSQNPTLQEIIQKCSMKSWLPVNQFWDRQKTKSISSLSLLFSKDQTPSINIILTSKPIPPPKFSNGSILYVSVFSESHLINNIDDPRASMIYPKVLYPSNANPFNVYDHVFLSLVHLPHNLAKLDEMIAFDSQLLDYYLSKSFILSMASRARKNLTIYCFPQFFYQKNRSQALTLACLTRPNLVHGLGLLSRLSYHGKVYYYSQK